MLAQGLSTARVAEGLSMGQGTVNSHVSRILAKLEVHSRLEAVAVARQRGMLDDG